MKSVAFEYGTIYNMDCLKGLRELPDDYVDMTITSPPYNLSKAIRSDGIHNVYKGYSDNLSSPEYKHMIVMCINELLRVTKHYVFFNFQKLTDNKDIYNEILYVFRKNIKEEFIWAKKNPAAPIHPFVTASGFEYIICFTSEERAKNRNFSYCNFNNRNKTSGKMGVGLITNCIIENSNMDNRHEGIRACFPKWLPRYFIKHFSKPKDIILDPFMGSGETAVASKQLDRQFIGFELDKERAEYGMSRLSNIPEKWF